MNFHHVAVDVCREAVARRYVAAVAALILLSQFSLLMALDIDVVEGVINTSTLFGKDLGSAAGTMAEETMQTVLRAVVLSVFHLGTLFGIVATSDIAIKLLSPGRVELALSLPVRRWELTVGIYLGVLLLAFIGMSFAVSGFAFILFWKADFVSIAPFIGATAAALGFAAVYAVMLLASVVARSQSLASGAGLGIYIISVVTSDREAVVSWFERGWARDVANVLIAPLPRLQTLVSTGWEVARGVGEHGLELAGVVAGTCAFTAALLAAAATVVWYRDY